MEGRGNSFSWDYSTDDSFETSLPQKPTPEEKWKGYIYPIDNELVEDLRRITRAYEKKIGGLPIIIALPRREYHKKDHP